MVIVLRAGEERLLLIALGAVDVKEGQSLSVSFPKNFIHIFDKETEKAIH